ncbi:MAG: hypothetical protein KA099_12650 [Alphaproteobacteria bacterium]|nr:hypothetical protein [Alphaproteobacteria bacterium]MBP7760136.1 hypothetical protein [Alphaproteobacteria bacterium]MBP7763505.1 hypothetical protein [Alphaproteobacteria bacterium]MBP7906160.1 hypothetical protein [Alphaproteobacteria bacterium]
MKNNSRTILDMMIADVYLNREDGSVTVLHDRAFSDELLSFEYDVQNGDLIFIFDKGPVRFGVEFLGEFADFIIDTEPPPINESGWRVNLR